jgi:hypothetical protein
MNKIRILIRYLTLLSLGFLITGCLFSKPTNSNITGLWVEHLTGEGNSQLCGTIEFFENGEFEAKDIPSKYFIGSDYLPERFDASGTWELDTSSSDPFTIHQIRLNFAPLEKLPLGFDDTIYIAVGGETLFSGLDDSVLFVKGEKCE